MVNLNGLLFYVSDFVSITGCLKVYFRIQFSYNKWIEEREKINKKLQNECFSQESFKIKANALLKLILITLAT
jgi:hypothetical protein